MVVALESEDENHVKSEENNWGMRGVEREIKNQQLCGMRL